MRILSPALSLLYRASARLSALTATLRRRTVSLRHPAASAYASAPTARNTTLRSAKVLPPTPSTHSSPLYTHVPHPHVPQNATERHHAEQAAGGFNRRLAVWVTSHVGTMQCAYAFLGIGIGSLVGIFTGNAVLAAVFGSISSYVLQLVLLPVLAVGQEEQGRHAELQSDEQFRATQRTLHESDQMAAHLSAQDVELLRQTAELLKQTPMIERALDLLHALAMAQGIRIAENPATSADRIAPDVPQVPIPLASHPAATAARARRTSKPKPAD